MPWAVGFVALVTVWLGRRAEPTHHRPRTATAALLVLAALALGAITVTNGWSLPTYVGLLLALLGADWLVHGTRGGFVRSVRTGVTSVVLPAAVVIGGAVLAFRPFWRQFSPPARQWGAEVGPFARPGDVLTIFGLFLTIAGAVLLPDVAAHPRARRAAARPPAPRRDVRRGHRARAVAARPRRSRPSLPAPGGLDPDVRARHDGVRSLPCAAPRDAGAPPPPAPARHLRVCARGGVRVRVRLGPDEYGVQVLPRGVAPLRPRVRHGALRAVPRRSGARPGADRVAGRRRRGGRGWPRSPRCRAPGAP